MLPSYYEFNNGVKIISGDTAVDNIPHEFEQMGVSRPLLVTDKGVVGAGLLKYVKNAFADSLLTIGAIYDQTPPDSSLDVIREVAGIYRDNDCDCILAVGGGSPMDTAKGVNIAVTENCDDLLKFAGAQILKRPLKPMIAVPTTAGTGSEVTLVAVISDIENSQKLLFTSHHLLPRVAVLDPRMTLTLPPRITAATGMDALVHAIEGYICLQHNPMSDAYAVASITLIGKHLVDVVRNGANRKQRLILANAATMAGVSFSNSMVGIVHSLAHATGAVAHVPHGEANAIFLPFGLEYNLETCADRISELLMPLAGEAICMQTPANQRASAFIKVVRGLQWDLFHLCGLPMTLKDAGVEFTMLEEIAQKAVDDGALTYNPQEMNPAEAMRILRRAYE